MFCGVFCDVLCDLFCKARCCHWFWDVSFQVDICLSIGASVYYTNGCKLVGLRQTCNLIRRALANSLVWLLYLHAGQSCATLVLIFN